MEKAKPPNIVHKFQSDFKLTLEQKLKSSRTNRRSLTRFVYLLYGF